MDNAQRSIEIAKSEEALFRCLSTGEETLDTLAEESVGKNYTEEDGRRRYIDGPALSKWRASRLKFLKKLAAKMAESDLAGLLGSSGRRDTPWGRWVRAVYGSAVASGDIKSKPAAPASKPSRKRGAARAAA